MKLSGMTYQIVQALPLACLLCAVPCNLLADVGDPLAVRQWPGGTVSVETHWGLHLVVDPSGTAQEHLPRKADQIISPDDVFDHYLARQPNDPNVSWAPTDDLSDNDPNAIRVKSIRQPDGETMLRIEADGVRIVYIPASWFVAQTDQTSVRMNLPEIANPDLLILGRDSLDHLTSKGTLSLLKLIKPRSLLFNRIHSADHMKVKSLQDTFGADQVLLHEQNNTIALSNADSDQAMRVFVLANMPGELPDSLSALFAAMERANANSQAVFAEMSTNQLNFKPANGTHTPRWNAEHMMGRQLLFFSQIYHAKDSAIPVMDLNPKQMPADYVFAHPDWDGREEARQMQRVSEFTRRFSYLLDDVPLDEKAPGSRWTLRGLLKQMQRHYGEHTANTVKKFDLPGWPQE